MSDETRDDIRTTGDEVIADAERLKELERRKQDESLGDDEMRSLAAQAEQLAQQIADKTRVERKLADHDEDPA